MSRLTPKGWKSPHHEIWHKLGRMPISDEPFRSLLSQALRKLAHYEDMEEQGLLLKLPCKVGGTVYLVCYKPTKCSKHQEYRDEYNCQGCEELYCDSRIEYYIHPIDSVKLDWIVQMEDCIGDTVFLTKEEAEKALAELKGESND